VKRKMMLLVVALMAFTIQARAKDKMDGGVEKAIAGMEQQWVAASKADNPDAAAPLLADSLINTDSDGTVSDKTATLARFKGAKWETNEISDVKVSVYGNTAIATGAWRGKGTSSDGKAVNASERWTDTWIKMPNGKWQCVASQSSPMKM
jgi:ketosteroid isomerase-like protein